MSETTASPDDRPEDEFVPVPEPAEDDVAPGDDSDGPEVPDALDDRPAYDTDDLDIANAPVEEIPTPDEDDAEADDTDED